MSNHPSKHLPKPILQIGFEGYCQQYRVSPTKEHLFSESFKVYLHNVHQATRDTRVAEAIKNGSLQFRGNIVAFN